MKKKIVSAVILCRIGSSRLKNKLFLKINNKTVLDIFIDKILNIKEINEVVLATTSNKIDDKIELLARKKSIKYFRGSEKNVLSRIKNSITVFDQKPTYIIRANSDNPMLSPLYLKQSIKIAKNTNYDLISPFYFNSLPFGTSLCIIKTSAIDKICNLTNKQIYKEHVENYILENKKSFKVLLQKSDKFDYLPNLNLTLDYLEDYKRIKYLYNKIIFKNDNYKFNKFILKKKLTIKISNDLFNSNFLEIFSKKKYIIKKINSNKNKNILIITIDKFIYTIRFDNDKLYISFNNSYVFYSEIYIKNININCYLYRIMSFLKIIFITGYPRKKNLLEHRVTEISKFHYQQFFSNISSYVFPTSVYICPKSYEVLMKIHLEELKFTNLTFFKINELNKLSVVQKDVMKRNINVNDIMIITNKKIYLFNKKKFIFVSRLTTNLLHNIWHSFETFNKRLKYCIK